MRAWLQVFGYSDAIKDATINAILREFVMSKVSCDEMSNMETMTRTCPLSYSTIGWESCGSARGELSSLKLSRAKAGSSVAQHQPKEWFLSVRLYNFDYVKLITFSPLDCPEVIEAVDALKKASLAMMRDIQRSDAKQPKLLMAELFLQ